jgi:hypothetical protein
MRQKQKRALVFVTIYAVTLCYGGPEEGGWWWDRYEPMESRRVPLRRVAQVRAQLAAKYDDQLPRDRNGKVRDYSSVRGGYKHAILRESVEGEFAIYSASYFGDDD